MIERLLTFPLDEGFLRRECPNCLREFKWFGAEAEGTPDEQPTPEVYYCPYCGQAAATGEWWTPEQLEIAQQTLAGLAHDHIAQTLGRAIRDNRDSWISFELRGQRPPSPAPITEPSDMVIVASPCHPFEPVKIDEAWDQDLHCLVCGTLFQLPPAEPPSPAG
jgi:hypothetical protein